MLSQNMSTLTFQICTPVPYISASGILIVGAVLKGNNRPTVVFYFVIQTGQLVMQMPSVWKLFACVRQRVFIDLMIKKV